MTPEEASERLGGEIGWRQERSRGGRGGFFRLDLFYISLDV